MFISKYTYKHIGENLENLASILDKVGENQEIIVIKRQNNQDVALIAANELSSLLESVYLLRSPRKCQTFI